MKKDAHQTKSDNVPGPLVKSPGGIVPGLGEKDISKETVERAPMKKQGTETTSETNGHRAENIRKPVQTHNAIANIITPEIPVLSLFLPRRQTRKESGCFPDGFR